MLQVHPKLNQAFEADLQKLVSIDLPANRPIKYIEYEEVLRAHYLIADYFQEQGEQVICGVKDHNLLCSAIGRQTTGFAGKTKWNTMEEVCATLFYGIVKNHSFHDCNKRTGLLVLIYQLYKNGRTFTIRQRDLDRLAINVASNRLFEKKKGIFLYKEAKKIEKLDDKEICLLAHLIHKYSRPIDKRFYTITYQEFNRLLNKHNVFLENPSGNFIDVIKIEDKRVGGFLGIGGKTEQVRTKVLQIGFPSWKSQMHSKALKEVLKATRLTSEYGIDSQVFFNGVEPMNSLIAEYSGPLTRLKNK